MPPWNGKRTTLPAETRRYLDRILGSGWDNPQPGKRRYRVFNTDRAGLNLRDVPSSAADVVAALPEGTVVEAQDRAWRPVHDPAGGADGWAVEQFLAPA